MRMCALSEKSPIVPECLAALPHLILANCLSVLHGPESISWVSLSQNLGSWPLLVKWVQRRWRCPRLRGGLRAGRLSWGEQEAAAEEIEAGTAKHLALEHLQAVDVPFDWASAPREGHPSFDRVLVLIQPFRKASQRLQRTGGRADQ